MHYYSKLEKTCQLKYGPSISCWRLWLLTKRTNPYKNGVSLNFSSRTDVLPKPMALWHWDILISYKGTAKHSDNMKRDVPLRLHCQERALNSPIQMGRKFWIKHECPQDNEIQFCRGKEKFLYTTKTNSTDIRSEPILLFSLIYLNMMIRWTKLPYKIFIQYNLEAA